MQSSSGSEDIVEHRILLLFSGEHVASTGNALSVSEQERELIAFCGGILGDGAQGSCEENLKFFTFELAVSGRI